VIDTREQNPLSFNADRVDVVIDTLHTGDYSLRGHEAEVAVERKSIDDLVNTLTHGRERFQRELERMQTYVLRVVVVEGSWTDLAQHRYHSQAHPSSIFGSMCCMQVDYGVPFSMCETRGIAARVVERLIRRYAENVERMSVEVMADAAAENVS
jgi:ERCC4-type nuclease